MSARVAPLHGCAGSTCRVRRMPDPSTAREARCLTANRSPQRGCGAPRATASPLSQVGSGLLGERHPGGGVAVVPVRHLRQILLVVCLGVEEVGAAVLTTTGSDWTSCGLNADWEGPPAQSCWRAGDESRVAIRASLSYVHAEASWIIYRMAGVQRWVGDPGSANASAPRWLLFHHRILPGRGALGYRRPPTVRGKA